MTIFAWAESTPSVVDCPPGGCLRQVCRCISYWCNILEEHLGNFQVGRDITQMEHWGRFAILISSFLCYTRESKGQPRLLVQIYHWYDREGCWLTSNPSYPSHPSFWSRLQPVSKASMGLAPGQTWQKASWSQWSAILISQWPDNNGSCSSQAVEGSSYGSRTC